MSGLTFACNTPDLLRERLFESGAIQLAGDDARARDYQDGAIIPVNPEPCEPETLNRLIVSTADAGPKSIHLLPAPSSEAEVRRRIVRLSRLAGDDAHECTTACDENMPTTTRNNGQTGPFVGAHLDDKDGLPVITRAEGSRRRLGWNFGPGARALLVATIDIYGILDSLGEHDPNYKPTTADVRRYARQVGASSLRFIWMRLYPNDAYAGSSEEWPHDGSTHGENVGSYIGFWLSERAIAVARGEF